MSYEPPPGTNGYEGYPGYPNYQQPPTGGYGGQPGQPGYPGPAYGTGWGDPGLGLPDGVVIASHGRRIGAYFLAIPLSIVTLGIGYVIWGLIVWGQGTSPALQVLGMKAWKPDQRRRAEWGDLAARNLLDWLVGAISCGASYLVSFILFLSDEPRHRTLADRMGNTVIVHDPHRRLG